MSKLNKEYHSRVGIVLNSESSYNSTSCHFDCTYLKYYNYRRFDDGAPSLKYKIGYTINYIKTWNTADGFRLCPKYYYSSGMSHPEAYKIIPERDLRSSFLNIFSR